MAVDYARRLNNLRARRLGLEPRDIAFREATELAKALTLEEAYEKRSKAGALRYALGTMQEVDPASTKVSVDEGERVRAQLQDGLPGEGAAATFDYQGSVPLNVHIRGTSDVDLLVLQAEFLSYDPTGPAASSYLPIQIDRAARMAGLRKACETVLARRFYGAKVDTTGGKAVSVSGGSLRRKVDVVPAHWDDTATYQASWQKHDRQIYVLDQDTQALTANRPFMHMKQINDKDAVTLGGTKKAVRMLKNLRKDAEKEIELSSYDIASIVWNFPDPALTQPSYLEIALITATQMQLRQMLANRPTTDLLKVPDGSRKVMDSAEKYGELEKLAREVDQLVLDIAREVNPLGYLSESSMRDTLMRVRV